MGKFIEALERRGYCLQERIFYYENRPLPYSEVWVCAKRQMAVVVDHGLCDQPACGATWSYRSYVEQQNEMTAQYRWLRYALPEIENLLKEEAAMDLVTRHETWKRQVDPRKLHPQLIGEEAYQKHLAALRAQALHGRFQTFVHAL